MTPSFPTRPSSDRHAASLPHRYGSPLMALSKHPLASRLLIVAVLVILALLAWHFGLIEQLTLTNLKARQADLSAWTQAHWGLALAGFFVLYVVVTAVSIPGAAVLTLAAGALFGLVKSEEHTSELQSLMRTSYAVFCLKKKTQLTTPI